jgi:hypothetical protein
MSDAVFSGKKSKTKRRELVFDKFLETFKLSSFVASWTKKERGMHVLKSMSAGTIATWARQYHAEFFLVGSHSSSFTTLGSVKLLVSIEIIDGLFPRWISKALNG